MSKLTEFFVYKLKQYISQHATGFSVLVIFGIPASVFILGTIFNIVWLACIGIFSLIGIILLFLCASPIIRKVNKIKKEYKNFKTKNERAVEEL